MKLLENELNGKKIAYCEKTEFLIQLGKGKSSYKTKMKIVGDLGRAVMIYNMLNIGNGYKKRLISWNLNRPVLVRVIS